MSALLVDDLVVPVPTRSLPRRWRHVEHGPQGRPPLVGLPGGRPQGVAAPEVRASVPAAPVRVAPARPAASAGWQLTDRGIAVVVVFFLALVATAAVVLVGGFLAVSNAPVGPVAPVVPAVAGAAVAG